MMSISRLRPPSLSCTALILENLNDDDDDDDLDDILENFVVILELNLMSSMEVRLAQIAI
ncbi:hypothetical protein Hanom_Chr11g01056581 [Helianthus anomalus]